VGFPFYASKGRENDASITYPRHIHDKESWQLEFEILSG
jgi:hypothetical protein